MTQPSFDLPALEPRNRMGWVLLAAIVAFLVLAQLSMYLARPAVERLDLERYESLLKTGVTQREALRRLAQISGVSESALGGNPMPSTFEDAISDLAGKRKTDPEAAKLYIEMRTEAGQKIVPDDLLALKRVATPENRAFSRIYGSEKLTREELQAVLRDLEGDGFVRTLARVHARERAGVKDPRAELTTPERAALFVGALTLASVGLLGGMLLWPIYFGARSAGKLRPLGHPVGTLSGADSDRHAMRAAQILLIMVALSSAIATIKGPWPKWASEVGSSLALVLAVLMLSRIRVGGFLLSMSRLGATSNNLGKNVAWGIAGAVANVPVVAVLGILGVTVFRFLPPPEHPASVELMANPSVPMILATLFAASIAAPIIEETCFRGALLPAISAAFRHVPSGILLSSIIFATIHPTGIPAWPALAGVGAMAAMLTYQTRSLVPAIVMHACHNFFTLMLALSLS